MKKISYAQLEKYENDGYVVVENVLDEKLRSTFVFAAFLAKKLDGRRAEKVGPFSD